MSLIQGYGHVIPYDLTNGIKNYKEIIFSKGDRNSSRISFFIQNGYSAYDIGEYKARAIYTSPTGEKINSEEGSNEVVVEGDKVIVNIPTSALAEKGYYILEVNLYNNEEKKYLMEVKYYVRETSEGEYVGTSNNKDLLQQLDGKIDGLTKRVDNLEENGGNGSVELPNDLVRYIISTNEPTDEELQEGMTIWFGEEV